MSQEDIWNDVLAERDLFQPIPSLAGHNKVADEKIVHHSVVDFNDIPEDKLGYFLKELKFIDLKRWKDQEPLPAEVVQQIETKAPRSCCGCRCPYFVLVQDKSQVVF